MNKALDGQSATACGTELPRQLLLHLSGGVRADLSDPNVLKVFRTNNRADVLLPLPGPYLMQDAVKSLGLVALGTDEIIEIDFVSHRFWHPSYRKLYSPSNLRPPELWGAIAHSTREHGDIQSAPVMENVSFHLMAMGRRLRDISDAYGMQLEAALASGVNEDTTFSNTQVFDLFLNCHSFLTEACSARDHLASFLGRHVYGGIEVDSAANLLKALKNRKGPPSHPMDAILDSANNKSDPGGWMVRLGKYRNTIAHKRPLTYMRGRNTSIRICFQQLSGGEQMARIVAPIPADPFDPDSGASVDALELLHVYSVHLLHFAAECARYSPYDPSFPQLNSTNILSLTLAGQTVAKTMTGG